MKSIGIVYTTFLRPQLANQTLATIKANWHPAFSLIIGEQIRGNILAPGAEPIDSILFKDFPFYDDPIHPVLVLRFPFDCGVSLVRNALINRLWKDEVPYCLVTADSIAFTQHTVARLDAAVAFLEAHPDVGILGFDLKDRVAWEWYMELKNQRFVLSRTPELTLDEASGLLVKSCDICRQFFLARVDAILKVKWDEAFKTGDHEDFFWRFKQSGYKVYWTPDICGQYIHSRPPEYAPYRNRQYTEYMRLLFKKYNLTDWVEYAR